MKNELIVGNSRKSGCEGMEEKKLEKWIQEKRNENGQILLGEIPVDDQEFDELCRYTAWLINLINTKKKAGPDIRLAVTMVQIAIRYYQEGNYWSCFCEALDEAEEDISQVKRNYLGKRFVATLQKYDLLEINTGINSPNMYVENIKAHAFVTNSYMGGFFDFAFDFYEKNLFRTLSDDVEDDLKDLSVYMKANLTTGSAKEEFLTERQNGKQTQKSYKLLKSTRNVIAECNVDTVYRLFYPVLKMVDQYYYYDDIIPWNTEDRFKQGFLEWTEARKYEKDQKERKKGNYRRLYSHKPFIQVSVDTGKKWLIIPQQKYRNQECSGRVQAVISIGNKIYTEELEVFRSFGNYISEERKIFIDDKDGIFGTIRICIETDNSSKEYCIHKADYRILDSFGVCVERLNKGKNDLLIRKGAEVMAVPGNCIVDRYSYGGWEYYAVNVTEETNLYVNKIPVSVDGCEAADRLLFDGEIKHYQVYDQKENKIVCTRKHPMIFCRINKNKISGAVLIINEKKKRIIDLIRDHATEEDQWMHVCLAMEEILPKTDGRYRIRLNVPGESERMLGVYLLFQQFDCAFEKECYIYESEMTLMINKDDKVVYPVEEKWNLLKESRKTAIYQIPVQKDMDNVLIQVVQGEEIYTVKLPVNVFQYGFDKAKMRFDQPKYLWYADVANVLYLRIPQARSAAVYWQDEIHLQVKGEEIKPSLFRFDISDISAKLRFVQKLVWQEIHVIYQLEDEEDSRYLTLPLVLRQMYVEPEFVLKKQNENIVMQAEVSGDAEVYVDVEISKTKQKVVTHRKIENGITVFPELMTNTNYQFLPVMEESDEFGFDIIRTEMPVKQRACIDFDKLAGCELTISSIEHNGKELELSYQYHVVIWQKENDDYFEGKLVGYEINGDRTFDCGKARLQVLSYEEELNVRIWLYNYREKEWEASWFDRKNSWLVKPDSPILDSTNPEDRKRLVELYEDDSFYRIDTTNLRRYVDVI